MDQYHVMIVGRYFHDIEDFMNIEMVCKKYRNLMGRYFYNPVPLSDERAQSLFSHIQTYHRYSSTDRRFRGPIKKKVIWYEVSYSACKKNSQVCEYKSVLLSRRDRMCTGDTIPPIVTSLGVQCFMECLSISSITIPQRVRSLGDQCFAGCSNLTTLVIPSSVTSLGRECLRGCSMLSSLSLPDSIERIGDSFLMDCTNIQSLTLPAVVMMGRRPYRGCSSMTSIHMNCSYSRVDNRCVYVLGELLSSVQIPKTVWFLNSVPVDDVHSPHHYEVPSTVTEIGERCFEGCSQLESVFIPSSVRRLGCECFAYCTSLSLLTLPTSLTVDPSCFFGCISLPRY